MFRRIVLVEPHAMRTIVKRLDLFTRNAAL